MENQLDFLKRLQAIDSSIRKIENIKLDFPLKIKQLEKELERRKQRLEKENASLEEIQKERRKNEQELVVDGERLKKSQDKLLLVKTNKEYQAALKEIEDIKKNNSDLETKTLILMEKADLLIKEMKQKEVEHQKWVQEFEKQKRVLQSEIEKSEVELENQQMLRVETIENLSPDLLKKYDMLITRRQGLAVVSIQDGLCQGCNMDIPPQRILEIRKNNDAISSCPFCNRIVYFEENTLGKD